MSENRTIHLVEIPVGGNRGFTWNRLHGEREDICEALARDSELASDPRRELFQARLRKVDDALDRLMSGSYGNCSKCGQSIDDTKLDLDPALALCLDCSRRESISSKNSSEVMLSSLNAFDTILLRTHNSDYRMLLLDPETGRALVEGGACLSEPSEALLRGSAVPGSLFKSGVICVGCRLEIWIDERAIITSPIRSIHINHSGAAEWMQSISDALN